MTTYTAFTKYAVCAESVEDFCKRFHKPGLITDFNRFADYESHKQDMEIYGFTFIPAPDSVTGEIVSYYGKI